MSTAFVISDTSLLFLELSLLGEGPPGRRTLALVRCGHAGGRGHHAGACGIAVWRFLSAPTSFWRGGFGLGRADLNLKSCLRLVPGTLALGRSGLGIESNRIDEQNRVDARISQPPVERGRIGHQAAHAVEHGIAGNGVHA